jgi:hypothetical protein
MTIKKSRKLMTFPDSMIELVEKKALKFGLDFHEYIRYLIISDIEAEKIEFVDMETEESIGRALKQYQKGEYKTIKNEKELKEYFKKLNN